MSKTSPPPGLQWDDAQNGWLVTNQKLAKIVFIDPHVDVVPDPQSAATHIRDADEPLTPNEFFRYWFSRNSWHERVRHELRQSYSWSSIQDLTDKFEKLANTLARDLGDRGDLVEEYFTPYAMRSAAWIMDVPETEWENVEKVVTVITHFLKKPLDAPGSGANRKEVHAIGISIRYLRGLFEALSQKEEQGEVVRALDRIAKAEGASIWLAVATIGQLLSAGVEPLITGAALACREIYSRPELRAALRKGSVDLGQVAEEALRLNPPFPRIHRWVQEPCDCLGLRLEPKSHLIIQLRDVNRDPDVVDSPNEFRPDRSRSINLTFGRGSHLCLGVHSARLQTEVMLRSLLDHKPSIRIDANGTQVIDERYLLKVDSLPFYTPE